jgi:hypothetical protein
MKGSKKLLSVFVAVVFSVVCFIPTMAQAEAPKSPFA